MFKFPSTLVELFAQALQDQFLTVHVHQPGFFHPSTRNCCCGCCVGTGRLAWAGPKRLSGLFKQAVDEKGLNQLSNLWQDAG